MKTLNSLKTELEAIVNGHKFLNAFYYGDLLEIISTKEPKIYPAIFCNIEAGGDQKYFNNFTVELMALDKVSNDHAEIDDVLSDTYQYLKDFSNILRYSTRWQQFSRVSVNNVPKRTIIDLTKDSLSGWVMSIEVSLIAPYGICNLPLDGYDYGPGSNPGCADVRIFVNELFLRNGASGSLENIEIVDSNRDPVTITINEFNEVVVDCQPSGDDTAEYNGVQVLTAIAAADTVEYNGVLVA